MLLFEGTQQAQFISNPQFIPSLKQVVTLPTRLDPPRILDPVITSLHKYYQPPVTKPRIENDSNKNGKPSDHIVVIMIPISENITCLPRETRIVEYRPLLSLVETRWDNGYRNKTGRKYTIVQMPMKWLSDCKHFY